MNIQSKNTNTNPQIEVELRSMFDKKKYEEINKFLNANAKDLGKDDKDVHFFILPDKLVKVVNNISKKNAKIVLKLTKIGKGSDFEEIEIPINQDYIEKAVKLFRGLGFNEVQHAYQKRHNYLYKGAELALKYSDAWGYHLELEKIVKDKKNILKAESQLRRVASELGVHLMTDDELAEFTKKKDREYQEKLRQKNL